MKYLIFAGLSFVFSGAVVGNAFLQKHQFYPSVVYITKSNPSMAVMYLQAFVFVILTGKLMRKIFFGQLRAAEMEHLIERAWYAVTETCLAFTVFRDDFSPRFVSLFTLLLFLKCFHWLAEDRVDYMERSPVISVLFHVRVLSLLTALGCLDAFFINHAYYSTILKGASVQLVFGFEYAILLTIILMTFIKYILHSIDTHNDAPWENKAVFLLYTELIIGFIKTLLYIAFMVIIIKVHTFPLFAIRPMYLTMRAFKKALHDVIMSRRAIRNMNTLYPDATQEELQAGDNVCIICREEMTTNSKKLPCNHIFHTSCLRSWFQRQQTCPTCRMDILRVTTAPTTTTQTPPPAQAPPQQPPQFPQMPPNFMFPGFPPVPPAPAQQPASTGATSIHATAPPIGSPPVSIPTPHTGAGLPWSMPPFMPFMQPSTNTAPFGLPSPRNLEHMSDEELRELEGTERHNVEARIMWLRDIQAYLNAAMALINQYNTVAAQQRFMAVNVQDMNRPSTRHRAETETTDSVKDPIVSPAEEKSSCTTSKVKVKADVPTSKPNYTKDVSDITPSHEAENIDVSKLDGVEGAVGYTPPKEELMPEWENDKPENDEQHEIRQRRLRFLSQDKKDSNDITLD